MLKKERQAYILHNVNLHNRLLLGDLTTALNVSEDTVRRDLQELAEQGKLIKVHGGALSTSFHTSFTAANVYALPSKKIIAHKAAALVHSGMFVLTTGGTTIIEMAKALPQNLEATFVTGSVPAALEYSQHQNLDVVVIGDTLSKSSQITVGGEAVAKINEIKADICFLGINALDIDNGLTDNDREVVQVKKAMMKSSERTVCLTISEKLNTSQRFTVCTANEIDILITELNPNDELLKPYKDAGVQII
jgi:DeoR/GlpR family transcriptional regulator of sugar metabolism